MTSLASEGNCDCDMDIQADGLLVGSGSAK